MGFKINDVTKDDAATVGKWARDPRFFYVYIHDGLNDPDELEKSGRKYAKLCDTGLQARKSGLSMNEFEGSLLSRAAQKGTAAIFNQVVKAASPWDRFYGKGLRDENGMLVGITVLLHEKKTGQTEIGYMLDPDYHGKGVGTSMVMSTLNWALNNTNDIQTLKADVDPSNKASVGILKKLGLYNVGDVIPAGPYKNPDGSPIPSQILEGSGRSVREAVQEYIAKGGAIYPVNDTVEDRKNAPKNAPDLSYAKNL